MILPDKEQKASWHQRVNQFLHKMVPFWDTAPTNSYSLTSLIMLNSILVIQLQTCWVASFPGLPCFYLSKPYVTRSSVQVRKRVQLPLSASVRVRVELVHRVLARVQNNFAVWGCETVSVRRICLKRS